MRPGYEKFNAAILTISDRGSRGERQDLSGPALKEKLVNTGDFTIVREQIVSDEPAEIETVLKQWSDKDQVDLILTTGGTGFSPRDLAPEATTAVIERQAPGFAEVMRAESLKITPHAMISRAVSGIRKSTLIINFPGSPKAARECLEIVLPALSHALQKLAGDPSDCGGS
ncbi:MAG TPA: MogA/MoaB family molybdenum cofactor biosynthesis protein [Desulfarculaceae bacterium]|nr:MogA/MoaB family molybdenum cofactor biosynthesis protein [Desulfarculaceae bacterium]